MGAKEEGETLSLNGVWEGILIWLGDSDYDDYICQCSRGRNCSPKLIFAHSPSNSNFCCYCLDYDDGDVFRVSLTSVLCHFLTQSMAKYWPTRFSLCSGDGHDVDDVGGDDAQPRAWPRERVLVLLL